MAEILRKHADLLLTLGLVAGGFVLYTMTAAPSVLMADAGEFQFVPYVAGITHPTGYPLYTILGWIWTHLASIGDVAYRMNLFSALWGAIALGLTYQVVGWSLRLGAPECPPSSRRVVSLMGALLFGVSGTFWSQAVIAEVYTLNAAFVAGVFYLALRLWHASTGPRAATLRWLTLLSFVYGLSLTHHRTMALCFPWLALFVWLVLRRDARLRWSMLWPVLAGLLIPQVLYLYIPWRAPHVPYAELQLDPTQTLVLYENSVRGFLDLVLGGAFGGQVGGGALTTSRVEMAFELLRAQFTWVGIGLGLIGVVAIASRRAWPLLVLTVLPYASYVAFNLIYFIGDVYVLFIPSYLIWAIWVGWGVWELACTVSTCLGGRSGSPSQSRHGRWVTSIGVLSLCLPLFLLASNYPRVDQSANRNAEHLWRPILEAPLPQGSILVSNDRDEIMPMWYYQYVDGSRPDLLGLFPLIVRQPGYGDVVEVVGSVLESGRPTYLIKAMPGLELKFDTAPRDPLVQVLATHEDRHPEHALDASFGDTLSLIGYDAAPGPDGTVRVTLFWKPLRPMDRAYSSFVHLDDAAGKTAANHDHQPGGDYYPTQAWKPGEVLLDTHVLSPVPGLPEGDYRLTAGLYVWPSMERLGEETEIGRIHVGGPAGP